MKKIDIIQENLCIKKTVYFVPHIIYAVKWFFASKKRQKSGFLLDNFCKKVYIASHGGIFMDCEIVLLVENIDICRYFYRETLGLGEPEMDSNFEVIFRLNESTVLVLEQCDAKYLEHSSSACRFALNISDIDFDRSD